MSDESSQKNQQQQTIRTCKFYSSNFNRPRVYPPRKTILIDLPQSPFVEEQHKFKHGAAQWTQDGLGSKRFRLSGKVEGNLNKLRMHDDDDDAIIPQSKENVASSTLSTKSNAKCTRVVKDKAPVVGSKRSRYASLIDEDEDKE